MQALLELASGLALLAAAVAITLSSDPSYATASGDPLKLGSVPSAGAGQGANRRAAGGSGGSAAARQPMRPEGLRIPRLDVRAPVLPVSTNAGGSLGVPGDPHVVGWWKDGAEPGARRGTAVIAGHINTAGSGPGALSELGQLRPGDRIVITGSGREIGFRVVALRQYPKARLPAKQAFSQRVRGRIALVSCAGPLNLRTGHYRDNIIAYAVPDVSGR